MDRRAFVITSLGAAAIGGAMPWFDGCGLLSDRRKTALVLLDSTLPASRAYAKLANEKEARRIEVGRDIGTLWHGWLRDWPGTMRGVLRPSDCFVVRNFAIGEGREFDSVIVEAGAIAVDIGAFRPARPSDGIATLRHEAVGRVYLAQVLAQP